MLGVACSKYSLHLNLPSCKNFGFSRVPSVASQEFVEKAIMITKLVKLKLNKAPFAIFERPLSDAMFEDTDTLQRCHGNQMLQARSNQTHPGEENFSLQI